MLAHAGEKHSSDMQDLLGSGAESISCSLKKSTQDRKRLGVRKSIISVFLEMSPFRWVSSRLLSPHSWKHHLEMVTGSRRQGPMVWLLTALHMVAINSHSGCDPVWMSEPRDFSLPLHRVRG